MKRLAAVVLCLTTLVALTACVGDFSYDHLMYPDARYYPGDQ